MGMLPALALSIGVLIAVWTYIALGVAALPVWAGIVAWACFFAAGGKTDGLLKTLASTLSGVFWAFAALYVYGQYGNQNVLILSVLVGVIAFIMVMQSKIAVLAFIPGAFLGAATAVSVVVGANGTWSKTVVALVLGAIFGWASEAVAGMLSRGSTKAEARVA
jgi:hypothetical protein